MPALALILSTLFSYLLTKPTIKLAKKYNLVTNKKTRIHPAHTHTGIIPRAGGLPIYLSILITTILCIPANKIMIGILISSLLLVVLGLLDDYYDISPYKRFFANIAIAVIVISFGLGIPFISNPFGEVIRLDTWKITFDFFGERDFLVLANLFAVFWLVWLMNMVNWSKGVDGQLPGFVAITALFLGLIAQRFTAHDIQIESITTFSFIVAGSYLGFLPFNYYPQKIMPGYGGGALAGFLLGVLSILSFGKLGTAILILAIPMIDAIYTIIRRVNKRQSPFRADWGHFHHKLLEIGWGKRRIALFYWLVSLMLGLSSLLLDGEKKFIAFVTTGLLLLLFIIIIERMKKDKLV